MATKRIKIMKKLILSVSLLAAVCFSAVAQKCISPIKPYDIGNPNPKIIQVNYSDVAVEDAEVTLLNNTEWQLKATIITTNTGNNDAYGIETIVMLPGEVSVGDVVICKNDKARVNISAMAMDGYIKISADHLERRANADQSSFSFTIKVRKNMKPDSQGNGAFGVLVYSKSPDSDTKNNYWAWTER